MSTFISEPGTRIGGRYRLEDRISASSGWAAWKAIDETLARAVTVLTFARGYPRIGDAVTAARAASRLTDARLAQVFDVEEDWDHAYVVMEWVVGDSLEDLLADGPLDPAQGAEIIAQAAEALAVAHAAGVAHLCLNPHSLRWTSGGGVKIVGLGIEAALAGITVDDPARADTEGLGKLLYAALTAHWPGGEWPSLPPAPEIEGHPCSPRQVRAGVPAGIDDVTCQVLFAHPHGGGPTITTPAVLATALNRVIPAPAAPPPAPRHVNYPGPGHTAPGSAYQPWDDGRPVRAGRGRGPVAGRRSGGSRAMQAFVGVLVLAVIGTAVWLLGHHGSTPPAKSHQHHVTPTQPALSPLQPAGAQGFDPLSAAAQDQGNENSNEAQFAIDNNPATAWHTQYYFSPKFGGLKTGTGLILDMGKPVKLSSVTVTFGSIPGASVRIELGNNNTRAPATLGTFSTVAKMSNASGTVTFPVHSTATGRYVLIWFTKLPPQTPGSTNRFEADVFNVVVKGTP
jgi:serine/threonine protein kinase